MSQQPPSDAPFVPPPPPSYSPYPQNSPYSQEELARQAAVVASDAKQALILSIVGFFCCGLIFGVIAYRSAERALDNIAIYEVGQQHRSLAMTAKVLAIIDIVGWVLVIGLRILLLFAKG